MVAVAAATATAIMLGASWFVYRQRTDETCTGRERLTVAVAPDVAPRVRDTAAAWARDNPDVDGVCMEVTVTANRPSDVAAAIATQHAVTLTGLGQASETTTVPDVWMPDSSVWPVRLAALAPGFRPDNRGPIALSPVVVAMPEPVAASIGWKDRELAWSDVLDKLVAGTEVRVGTVEPTQDAAGLFGLLSLSAAAAARPNGADLTTAALRSVAGRGSTLREDLLAKFPQSNDAVTNTEALNAAALSEADIFRYNATKPAVPLAALKIQPAPAVLDYPFAVMPGVNPVKAAAAESLRQALIAPGFRGGLAALGLRAPEVSNPVTAASGDVAPNPSAGPPDSAQQTTAERAGSLDLGAVDRLLATWTVVTGPARMLAVIDVSGSMLLKVPTAGDLTRIQLTVQTARTGLDLLDDTWSVGLWAFAAQLDGDRDYRQLVPIGLLSSRRPQLLAALDTIEAGRGNNTGLYDTVLASYQAVQDDWQPGKANSVVLFTDGVGNDDPDGGLSEAGLLTRLKEVADPKRPVQMVLIGIGDEVDQKQLERIATASGSGSSAFIAKDPATIGEIFLKAVARRPVAVR